MNPLLLHDVEVHRRRVDVAVEGGAIRTIAPTITRRAGVEVLDGRGGALLPGLWDHHIHLMALAAARLSATVGPPDVTTATGFAEALRAAAEATPAGTWVRAVGHHESVGGDLDRAALDEIVGDRPVRVQHRGGALWVLSSAAVRRLDLGTADLPGIERDDAGRPTGRVYGGDRWLRDRLGPQDPPDLSQVGRALASRGVVGVTDATPLADRVELEPLAAARRTGSLPQHLMVTGGPPLTTATFGDGLIRGPVKIVLADHALPALDDLVGWIRDAHTAARNVAVHCVTRAALVLALAALDEVGVRPGDRIEHGSVVPPELRAHLARGGPVVVTQPGFVRQRGDQYLLDVDPDDRPHLYPCRTLLAAGVPVAGSTDAPFGDVDPWRAMATAVDRTTAGGEVLGSDEAVTAARALQLFLGSPHRPGGPPRRVEVGAPADLCLLATPLGPALDLPAHTEVRATIVAGQIVHDGT